MLQCIDNLRQLTPPKASGSRTQQKIWRYSNGGRPHAIFEKRRVSDLSRWRKLHDLSRREATRPAQFQIMHCPNQETE